MGYRIISCALTAHYLTSGDNNTLKAAADEVIRANNEHIKYILKNIFK